MDLKQFDKWMKAAANPTRYGWKPTHKKIAAYIRKGLRLQFRRRTTPRGVPWAKTYSEAKPKVGDKAQILVGGLTERRIVTIRIRSMAGKKRAIAYRKRTGPPFKGLPALNRPGAKHKVTMIRDWLTGPGYEGRSAFPGQHSMTYGYTPGTAWVEKLQFGGSYKKGQVPPREIMGLTPEDLREIDFMYAEAFLKAVLKGSA